LPRSNGLRATEWQLAHASEGVDGERRKHDPCQRASWGSARIGAKRPDATYTDIIRPNQDTLYSLMWFDVSKEPLLISVPDSGGRYYLLPMLDMWTDVFQSTGKRTTGTSAQLLAIAEPRWQGRLPAGAMLVHSPTAIGWIIGRTQTNGKADYDAEHKIPEQSGHYAAQSMGQIVPAGGG
jgi:hypothetical protein